MIRSRWWRVCPLRVSRPRPAPFPAPETSVHMKPPTRTSTFPAGIRRWRHHGTSARRESDAPGRASKTVRFRPATRFASGSPPRQTPPGRRAPALRCRSRGSRSRRRRSRPAPRLLEPRRHEVARHRDPGSRRRGSKLLLSSDVTRTRITSSFTTTPEAPFPLALATCQVVVTFVSTGKVSLRSPVAPFSSLTRLTL